MRAHHPTVYIVPQTSPKTPVVEKARPSLGQFKLFGHIRFRKSSRPNFDLFDVSIEKFTACARAGLANHQRCVLDHHLALVPCVGSFECHFVEVHIELTSIVCHDDVVPFVQRGGKASLIPSFRIASSEDTTTQGSPTALRSHTDLEGTTFVVAVVHDTLENVANIILNGRVVNRRHNSTGTERSDIPR